jgi:hypothetical protein
VRPRLSGEEALFSNGRQTSKLHCWSPATLDLDAARNRREQCSNCFCDPLQKPAECRRDSGVEKRVEEAVEAGYQQWVAEVVGMQQQKQKESHPASRPDQLAHCAIARLGQGRNGRRCNEDSETVSDEGSGFHLMIGARGAG